MRTSPSLAALLAAVLSAAAHGQSAAYNPYADSQEAMIAPIAADGTIQWGTFYKSAKLQQAYERLWNLGACRGSNKAITTPVAENKLVIDRLPEAEFRGIVQAASGQLAGGMMAFVEGADAASHAEPLVAQFHPAGVTRFVVRGQAPAAILAPGMIVRLRAEVDARGRGTEPVDAFEIVTPPPGFEPDDVQAGRNGVIVGTVVSLKRDMLSLRVDAGRIRRITLPLAADAVATLDASQIELVSAGDAIEVKGRLWTGDGALGAGIVFVSDVLVTKQPLAHSAAGEAPSPKTVGAR
jgi:hypothetical protein